MRKTLKPRTPISSGNKPASSSKEDPWLQVDPWSGFKPTIRPGDSEDVPMQTVAMIDQVEGRLRDQLASSSGP